MVLAASRCLEMPLETRSVEPGAQRELRPEELRRSLRVQGQVLSRVSTERRTAQDEARCPEQRSLDFRRRELPTDRAGSGA